MPCLVGKVYHFDNFITHYYITKVTQKPPSHFENILRLRVFCCGRISFGRFFAAPHGGSPDCRVSGQPRARWWGRAAEHRGKVHQYGGGSAGEADRCDRHRAVHPELQNGCGAG